MKIILLENIKNLGKFGKTVDVKNGYARNFLIPKKKAIIANKENLNYFLSKKIESESKLKETLSIAQNKAKLINSLKILNIKCKSSIKGKLFGSINANDIVFNLSLNNIKISKNNVRLKNGNLRNIGKHKVFFKLYNDIEAKIIVNIIPK